MNKYEKDQIGQSWFSIPRLKLSTFFCIPNRNFLSYTVVEISLTKIREKEKTINIKNNKQEIAGFPSHDTTCRCLPVYQI